MSLRLAESLGIANWRTGTRANVGSNSLSTVFIVYAPIIINQVIYYIKDRKYP